MLVFKNPNDPDNTIIRSKIKEWMHTLLGLSEKVEIDVAEYNCADPGCVDKETRIIVSENGIKKQYRVHKPIVFVRKPDIENLVKR
jgi:hypothetical protein